MNGREDRENTLLGWLMFGLLWVVPVLIVAVGLLIRVLEAGS